MPESIPAGYEVLQELDELDSLLIIDLGGTTLDISQVMGKLSGISKIYGDSSLGVSLVTSAVKDALSLARTKDVYKRQGNGRRASVARFPSGRRQPARGVRAG